VEEAQYFFQKFPFPLLKVYKEHNYLSHQIFSKNL